jgi:predicted dehydrogenase
MAAKSWLVIGAGAAGIIHIRQLMARGYEVTVTDADPAREQAMAAETGCQVGELAGHYDGAVIATPACTRLALVEQALEVADVVVCEKPVALTTADAQTIAGMAPGRLYVAESQCYGGPDSLDIRRMAERLQAGLLGRPVVWRVNAMTQYRPQSWCTDLAIGGGAFLEGGVHVLTTARVLFGEAVKWQASVQCFQGGTGPDTGTFLIDYERGDSLALGICWGTEGCFTGDCPPLQCAAGLIGPQKCLPWWPPDDHAAMWGHLDWCLQGKDEPVATMAHAAGAVADVWRCYAAAGIEPPGAPRARRKTPAG